MHHSRYAPLQPGRSTRSRRWVAWTLAALAALAAIAVGLGRRRPVPVTIELRPPVDVVVAPPDVTAWGPYQFPGLERCADGSIVISFHVEADSATAYGLPPGSAVSRDEGATWTVMPRDATAEGASPSWGSPPITLPDGGQLAVRQLRSRSAAELRLPPEPAGTYRTYGKDGVAYRVEDLPPECAAGWSLLRKPPGSSGWVEERARVSLPGEVRDVIEGVLTFPWFQQIVVAPDGALWSANYLRRMVDGRFRPTWAVVILRSSDQGRTWDFWAEIPYVGDTGVDLAADRREGFTEPFVCFLADGTAMCLLRTTDGAGGGPLYVSRSADNGRTWSPPQVFDRLGVWPQLLLLGNGVTLAAYGRPGLFVRAAADPAARAWGERVAIVAPGAEWCDTCSYASLLPLDEATALIAYSEFGIPDADGRPCKRIRVRRVTARRPRGIDFPRWITDAPRS